jgi:hypothetical protein
MRSFTTPKIEITQKKSGMIELVRFPNLGCPAGLLTSQRIDFFLSHNFIRDMALYQESWWSCHVGELLQTLV